MSHLFWQVFATIAICFTGGAALVASSWYAQTRLATFLLLGILLKRKFHIWLSFLQKIPLRNLFEALLRADTGKPLDRPYGAKRGIISWDKLQFSPVFLTRPPLNSDCAVDSAVTLGPLARKPLCLKIPILIGGMAYGSGYSLAAKIALAKGAALAGTAANSGNGPFLEEERSYAAEYILQYSRGFWSKAEPILRQADMIELALGHSARGSAPVRVNGKKITAAVAKRYGTIPGLDVVMESYLPEVENAAQLRELIGRLKEITQGIPIGIKFGASHYLEREMELFIAGGADVLTFDGTEGGTHGGMPLFMDDMGLPILPALCRAADLIRERGLRDKVSLVVGGGLVNPGHFAKCLALGADAVLIGTITALVQSHTQISKALPWEPPPGLLYNDGKEKEAYDPLIGAEHIENYLHSCTQEMQMLTRALGKDRLRDLNRADLVALDPLHARIAGVAYLNRNMPD